VPNKKWIVFSKANEWTRWSVSATLNWEIVEPFESLPIEMKKELIDLVNQAKHQASHNQDWENVRVIYYRWREPGVHDCVFPASKDISTMYDSVLDTKLIPKKNYQDWSCIYMIPLTIKVDENWWEEKRVISIA
jgi:hypothetical protein